MTELIRPIAIDAFSGAGGLALGLIRAGFDVRVAFDHDAHAVSTYRHNIGSHAFEADVKELTGERLLREGGLQQGECSLIAGGPPCQGFSVQRRGDDRDDRNDLIMDYLRLVSEIAPAMFLMENVSAIAGRRGKRVLDAFMNGAKAVGYRVQARVLDAADFGVPQRRKRMIVVGERDDSDVCFEFPTPTHKPSTYRTVRDAIGDLPNPSHMLPSDIPIPNHEPDRISPMNRLRISHVPPGGGREDIPQELRLPCHRVSVDRAGHRNVYGRLHWDEPAGTITTKCNSFTRGKFAHPEDNRNISMREAARLQGFPDDFIFNGDKVAVAHQIGNAVPPPLAEMLGRALRRALQARSAGSGCLPNQPQLALRL